MKEETHPQCVDLRAHLASISRHPLLSGLGEGVVCGERGDGLGSYNEHELR